jgi:hypothetical protein
MNEEALGWLSAVIAIVNKLEGAIGQLPRFEDGKLIMPESESLKVAAGLIDPAEVANSLLSAAAAADPALHSALHIAALNSQGADRKRIQAALKE